MREGAGNSTFTFEYQGTVVEVVISMIILGLGVSVAELLVGW